MKPINVLVVDDSAFMRKYISDILASDKRIAVIGTARNGIDAFEKVKQLTPDVVTMDVEMPVMDGLDAVKLIMKECAVPVIMLSSSTKKGADSTIQAMSFGAVDFIEKPSGAISLDLKKIQDELIEKVMMAAFIKPAESHLHDGKTDLSPAPPEKTRKNKKQGTPVVLIGTSTGGPRALQTVLSSLPGDLDAPVAVVQHMPAGFTASLAQRLDSLSELRIKEAEHLEVLNKGSVYIAPGGYHLTLQEVSGQLVAHLDKEEPILGHRPSVNALFESAAQLHDYRKVAVVMTGMGSDGTEGLHKLKQSGNTAVIAESEESCVVYGMPKSVVSAGLAKKIVHVNHIAMHILHVLETGDE
ncbi:chemotaxis response regulator protein-glutamate methylesterase [Fictibacillus iocasae]|uniref:Protein-glutamate methylesterase/protein-glutamine glutaminase n=1 Tax=Fictibacillus iocasae TaxID=2715437 RepID=A0ABW2NRH8_9BACL